MADLCYGKIEFGGALKESLIDELLEALSEDSYSSFGSIEEAQEYFRKEIESCRKKPFVLTVEEAEAQWGRLENTEDFCRSYGLTYVAYRIGGSEYTPEIETNEGGEENTYMVDGNDEAVISKPYLKYAISLIKDFKQNPKKIPLVLASGVDSETDYHIDKDIAFLVAKNINKDSMDILELHLDQRYKGSKDIKIPLLTIIKG